MYPTRPNPFQIINPGQRQSNPASKEWKPDIKTLVNLFCTSFAEKSPHMNETFASAMEGILFIFEKMKKLELGPDLNIPENILSRYITMLRIAQILEIERYRFYEQSYVKNAPSIQKLSSEITTQISRLNENECISIPCGFITLSREDHAMIIDITKQKNDCCTITVYNAENNLEYHDWMQTDTKKLSLIALKFDQVPLELLLFSKAGTQRSPLFFECLFFLRSTKSKRVSHSKIFYEYLFEDFWPYLSKDTPPLSDFKKPVANGCSPVTLIFKHLSYQLKEEKYKKIRFFFEYQVLDMIYLDNNSVDNLNQEFTSVLRFSIEKFVSRAYKLYTSSDRIIDATECGMGKDLAETLLTKLQPTPDPINSENNKEGYQPLETVLTPGECHQAQREIFSKIKPTLRESKVVPVVKTKNTTF